MIHETQTLSLFDIINRMDAASSLSWYEIMGIDVPGIDAAMQNGEQDDFAEADRIEGEYITTHGNDMYEIRWPEHVHHPEFNSDATYYPVESVAA